MVQNGLTPVTRLNHGHRYWRRFTSFEFARHLPECPVVEPEILQAAAAFPIAFRAISGEVEAVALLSVHAEGSTPFVSDEGTWLAQYLPSALRCPPFQVDLTGAQSEPQPAGCLMVDENDGPNAQRSRCQPVSPRVEIHQQSFIQQRVRYRSRRGCHWRDPIRIHRLGAA